MKRGLIRLLGHVMQHDVGRPLGVFGWHPVKHDNLLHEVQVTQVWQAITRGREHSALRLSDVDQRLRPDMELTIVEGDERDHYYVELDRGTVSHRAQKKRWDAYRTLSEAEHELLVVTTSEQRLSELVNHADAIAHLALFTSLETLLTTPDGNVWIDAAGAQHRV